VRLGLWPRQAAESQLLNGLAIARGNCGNASSMQACDSCWEGGGVAVTPLGRANGSDVKLQAAFTRERKSGAPLAATKEWFCWSELQAA